MNCIRLCLSFCSELISLRIMYFMSINNVVISFLKKKKTLQNIPLYIYHIFFILLSVKAPLGCFYILAIMNNVAMNMKLQIPLQYPDFNFFSNISKGGIDASYGSSQGNNTEAVCHSLLQ